MVAVRLRSARLLAAHLPIELGGCVLLLVGCVGG
jgi:hypothetical protein